MDNETFHKLVYIGATSIDLMEESLTDIQFDELLHVISHSPLQSLYLWGTETDCLRAQKLAEALHHNSSLRSLGLWDNRIGDAGVGKLAEALLHNSSLQSLYLQGNKIGDIGAEKLAEALYHNCTLQRLDIVANLIGDVGVEKLIGVLEKNPFITISIGNKEIDRLCSDEGKQIRMQQYRRLNSTKSSRSHS